MPSETCTPRHAYAQVLHLFLALHPSPNCSCIVLEASVKQDGVVVDRPYKAWRSMTKRRVDQSAHWTTTASCYTLFCSTSNTSHTPLLPPPVQARGQHAVRRRGFRPPRTTQVGRGRPRHSRASHACGAATMGAAHAGGVLASVDVARHVLPPHGPASSARPQLLAGYPEHDIRHPGQYHPELLRPHRL